MECRPATAGMKSAELPTDMIAMEKESPGEICLPTSCKAFVPNGSEPVIAIDNFYPQ